MTCNRSNWKSAEPGNPDFLQGTDRRGSNNAHLTRK
jgi:hypothetical protein